MLFCSFEKELAAESLRRNENETQKALDDLTNPDTNSDIQVTFFYFFIFFTQKNNKKSCKLETFVAFYRITKEEETASIWRCCNRETHCHGFSKRNR